MCIDVRVRGFCFVCVSESVEVCGSPSHYRLLPRPGLLSVCDIPGGAVGFRFPGRSVVIAVGSALIVRAIAFSCSGGGCIRVKSKVACLSGGQTIGAAVCFDFSDPKELCVNRTSPGESRKRGAIHVSLVAVAIYLCNEPGYGLWGCHGAIRLRGIVGRGGVLLGRFRGCLVW